MKPTQPLALPSTRALIDPPSALGGGQRPADPPQVLGQGPAPGDAPWFAGLPAPAWQAFQVAGLGGGKAPGKAPGRSDGRTDGGGRPGGRAANDPRSQPPTIPVKNTASKPTNAAVHPTGGKPEASKVVDPEVRFIRPDTGPPVQRLAKALKSKGDQAANGTRATGTEAARPAAAKPPEADSPKAQVDAAAAGLKAQLQKISGQAARDSASAYVRFNGTDPANGKFAHDTPSKALLDGVNDVKGKQNCQPCVVATVLRTMGIDASARNVAGKDLPVSKLEAFFGSRFEPMKLGKIFEAMGNAKDGTVAVIHGVRDAGKDGHVFTARKVDGRVHFEDGQTGQRADFGSGYTRFRFMQVK